MPEPLLAVVIPVGPDETEVPQGLIEDLHHLPAGSEIIFVGCDECAQTPLSLSTTTLCMDYPVKWRFTERGRAQQMNVGAEYSSAQFIWFLHIDSRFSPTLIDKLLVNLARFPNRLHYCLLGFMKDGPAPMGVNSLGANLRSLVLGVPFGDQGFLISKTLFDELGGYPQTALYGEDHLFVWYARQDGIKLKCCSQTLYTSARKYKRDGWINLTVQYQLLWITQAWPEFLRLIKQRYF